MDSLENLIWACLYFGVSGILWIWAFRGYIEHERRRKIFSKKKVELKKREFLWGWEYSCGENKRYLVKHIFLKKRSLLGRRYHKESIITIWVISGSLHINAEREGESHDIILHSWEAYEIYPWTRYFISAVTDARYMEISSYSNNDNHLCSREKYDRQGHRNISRKDD